MKLTYLALAGLGLIALAGCNPESAEPVAPVENPAVVAVAEMGVANALPSQRTSTFDQRSLAGTFTGTVGGAETALTLAGDGTYILSETRAGTTGTIDGTWTVEAEDRHIRLDPNIKAEPDRLFAITSTDTISPLGGDGQPLQGGDLARQESPATP